MVPGWAPGPVSTPLRIGQQGSDPCQTHPRPLLPSPLKHKTAILPTSAQMQHLAQQAMLRRQLQRGAKVRRPRLQQAAQRGLVLAQVAVDGDAPEHHVALRSKPPQLLQVLPWVLLAVSDHHVGQVQLVHAQRRGVKLIGAAGQQQVAQAVLRAGRPGQLVAWCGAGAFQCHSILLQACGRHSRVHLDHQSS